jgi:fused signal recognition particle receptor
MDYYFLFGLVGVLLLVVVVAAVLWQRKRKPLTEVPAVPEQSKEMPRPVETPRPTSLLPQALSKTRNHWWAGLSQLVNRRAADLAAAEWENLEETLLTADVSLATSQRLLDRVREQGKNSGLEFGALLQSEVEGLLSTVENGWDLPAEPKPLVISIVGVNGVGKTTTVGKLAYRFSKSGKKVLLGACDTFRAAAIAQLEVWAQRAECEFVSGREGADPGATAFDALTAGKARGKDVVLLDTAGRLHTKVHLMDELKRVHKVMKKVIPDAPHQIWLVVDGTLGQNSLIQAKQFHEALGLSGVIVTKLDGTARGGSVLSIASDLKLPIRFIGVGEGVGDLVPFESASFASALLAK